MKTKTLILKEELSQEFENILNYWMTNSLDDVNGGFVGHIDGDNTVIYDANKGAVLNARILWTFSAAYRISNKEVYKQMAERAYTYILNHFIDEKFGGVYWELNYKGEPVNKRKQIYAIAFTIYGLSEYHRAIGSEQALNKAIELYGLIEQHSFDTKRNGYFEALSEDWQPIDDLRLSEKEGNASKTMNTHLHILEAYTNLYRVWKNAELKKSMHNLIQLHIDKFINNETFHLNLFFDDDWNLKSDAISFGHDIECSWLLYEAAEVYGDQNLLKDVAQTIIGMARATFKGIQNDGGLINEEFPSKKSFDTDKHWWQQAEAVVGFYNVYQITNEQEFLNKALNSWAYIKQYIIDKNKGEWFWKVNERNEPYLQDEKAGFWKCPYHNTRACMELMERIY